MLYFNKLEILLYIKNLVGSENLKIIDMHSDIFTDIAFRRAKGEKNVFERVHLPKLKKGGVTGIIGVFWVEPIIEKNYRRKRFEELLSHVFNDLNESKSVTIVTTPESLLRAYQKDDIFIYLGIEGLSFLEEWDGDNAIEKISGAINELNHKSIKHSIFAWNESNFIATGSGNRENDYSGLNENGGYTIQQLEKNQWIIDVSHLNDSSFWDVVDESNVPLLASHSNARKLCAHERNLTDEQMKAIAISGGLIGVNAYGLFVDQHCPTLERYVDHICYIADLVGIEHVGFGFDFVDYLQSYELGSTMNRMTKGLENATKIPDLLKEMERRGFSTVDIEQIAFKNFYHFLSKMYATEKIGGLI